MSQFYSTPKERPLRPNSGSREGRIFLIIICFILGGTLITFGENWYEHYQQEHPVSASESPFTDLRFIDAENILDRIRKNESLHFIDIRSRSNFEKYHLLDSEWTNAAEIGSFTAVPGKFVIVVFDEEASHDQLRYIHDTFTAKKITFAFLEGGIRNWIAQGGTVIAEANPNSFIDQTKIIPISPEEVIGLQKTLVRSTFIDVRSDGEFQSEHIPGAINIPLVRIEKERSLIPMIGSLFVYGATETDSFQAGTRLFDMGFIGVRVINGGFQSWKTKKLPTTTSSE